MATEIEMKVKVTDAAAAAKAIASVGARYEGSWLEVDTFFDHPDKRLLQSDSALRMRVVQPLDDAARQSSRAAQLTYKGPRAPSAMKVRDEHQVDVPDPKTMAAILHGLRYGEVFSYEKRRQRWRMDDAEITLDEIPCLGHFVEVEAASEARVEELVGRLGFGDLPHITEGYVKMIWDQMGEPRSNCFVSLNYRPSTDKA